MVIGNGFIAQSLQVFKDNHDLIIFASGVSNSNEKNLSAYTKELNLLKSFLMHYPEKIFVYFSTLAVFDPSLQNSEYIKHKKNIEHFISRNAARYFIFRLPNVVGFSNNPHTLLNFFFNKIIRKEKVTVYKQAKRYLLDITDMQTIITSILIRKLLPVNHSYNINLYPAIAAIDIFNTFCKELSVECPYEIIDGGSDYSLNYDEMLRLIENKQLPLSLEFDTTEEYLKKMIKKYYYGRNL